MTSSVTPRDLSDRLAEEIEAVCRALGIRGHRSQASRSFIAECPWDHKKGQDPKLYIDCVKKKGGWINWRSGETGDMLWLVALTQSQGVRNREALRDAIGWAKDRYKLGGNFDRAAWEAGMAKVRAANARREADAEAELAKLRGRAQAVWLKSQSLAKSIGTPGWEYLTEGRGIDFKRIGRIPGAIRYEADLPYYEDGQVIYSGPGLVTCMTLEDASFGAIHRTWIDPKRPGQKIDLGSDARGEARPPRKMWPDTAGCVMRLHRGGSGLSDGDAVRYGLLEHAVTCEGMEDGLSIAMIAPERRIWPAGSLANLLSMVPPKCADELTIAADNDWNKPAAQAQLAAACRRFVQNYDLKVMISRSPIGKDFSDLVQAAS